jgi:hypothetical protein
MTTFNGNGMNVSIVYEAVNEEEKWDVEIWVLQNKEPQICSSVALLFSNTHSLQQTEVTMFTPIQDNSYIISLCFLMFMVLHTTRGDSEHYGSKHCKHSI